MQLYKNRKKSIKSIVLIGLFLFLSLTPITQQLIAKGVKNEKVHDNTIPHQSDMEYDSSFIHVDNNWTETVAEYECCSGSGTWNDPFIIENVEIFTNSSIAGIFINNSQNVFFKIENCIISNNSTKAFSAGIRLENTNNGKITSISSYQNKVGIMFIYTHNTSIEESDVYSNNYGICIWQSSSHNSLYENDILDNTVQGVNITNCNDNNLYHNNFINNTVNAIDSGVNNVWNTENQGNYWDDYGGKDRDDDGIGDNPYIISGSTGSQDNYPIWWDAPVINVIFPIPYSLYGSLPPNFSVYLEEGLSHSWWYTIDSNTAKNHFITNESIDAFVWSLLENGSHIIFFYVNDSRGYEDYEAIMIYKDIETPSIDIIYPLNDSIFGENACNFTVIVLESNLNSTWYTLNNGNLTYFAGISGQNHGVISQSEWELQPNGPVIINFFANDTVGNIGKNNVTVYKDIIAPVITITEPLPLEVFGMIPPVCTVSFYDINGISEMWYQLTDGTTTSPREWTDIIHIDDWNAMTNGTVTIIFYANDTLGNVATVNVSVYKDIIGPNIFINEPHPYDLFSTVPPICDVLFEDVHGVDASWYQLTNGTFTTISRTWTGSIDINDWSSIGNGTVIIIFYANDTLGNVAMANVLVYKDIISPSILINEPKSHDVFGHVPPVCNLTLYDTNSIDQVWYELTDGITTTTVREWTDTIHIDDWNAMANGTVTIIFYANDTLGNVATANVLVYKDIIAPVITITEPLPLEVFGVNPPVCIVSFYDINGISEMWYQLTDGITITSAREWTDIIHIDNWNAMISGTVTIIFFANDTLGNVATANVSVYKDIIAPIITINSPDPYEVYGASQPECYVLFEDIHGVDVSWYQLTDGTFTTSSRTWTGSIDINDWTLMGNGTVTIIFYANDTLGNVATANVSVYKDLISPSILINEPKSHDVFGHVPPVCNLTLYDTNSIDQVWYELTDGITTTKVREWTDTIYIDDWNAMANGTVTIIFYANDTLGNVATANVSVYKDIIAPIITINSPDPYEVYGASQPECDVLFEDIHGVDASWYQLTDGTFTTISRTWTGSIDINDWTSMDNGTVTIILYANDTLGNVATANVSVYKDIIAPIITITEPLPYEVFGVNPPACIVSFYDINGISEMWYQLTDGSTTTSVREWTDIIHIDDWNVMTNGTVTIIFFANDTLGNVGTANVSVYKDIIAPFITINSPDPYEIYGASQPECYVLFEDIHGVDVSWYQLTNGTFTTSSRTWTGSIDINDWTLMGNGTVTIIFYANDTLGNVATANVSVYKDIIAPVITITEPLPYEVFGVNPPACIVSFYDINDISEMWYQLTDGITTTSAREWTDTIHIDDWNVMAHGLVTIIFYANDSVNNLGFESISIYKDIIGPTIIINYPQQNEVYGKTAPTCSVTFSDVNGVNASWYQLANGTFTTFSRTWTGSIDINDWTLMANGTITIIFYANDTLGNIAMVNVSIYKDIIAPMIIINDPQEGELFGFTPPAIDLNIIDPHLESVLYQLTNGSIWTDVREWPGFIYQADWEQIGNGTVTILFIASDSVNNFASRTLLLRKNLFDPIVNIIDPIHNELFGVNPPNVTLYISSAATDVIWYRLYNSTFTTYNITWEGTISLAAWEAIGNGTLFIQFYINDTLGNIGFDIVFLRKDIIAPSLSINSPTPFTLWGTSPPGMDISYFDPNSISSISYQLQNEILTTPLRIWTGSILMTDWNVMGNGSVIIIFRAEDIVGNIAFANVTVRKDIIAPEIVIYYPSNGDLYGHQRPLVYFYINEGSGVSEISYQLISNVFNSSIKNWNGSIDQALWKKFGNGTVTIYFYATDIVGNEGYASVIVRKDIIAPTILIKSPDQYQKVGRESPFFEVNITDANLDSCWYMIIGKDRNISFSPPFGRIDQRLWESVWDNTTVDGIIIVRFYAQDLTKNLNYSDLFLVKEIAPEPDVPPPLLIEPSDLIFIGCLGAVAISLPIIIKKSRVYGSSDTKQKKVIQRVVILTIILLALITVFLITT